MIRKYFIYDISSKTLVGVKPLHIRFNKIDRFITIYDGTRYLALLSISICSICSS